MLRVNYRDLQSRKVLELKPRSFAQLLQYVDARVSAEPELPRRRFTPPRVSHRSSHGNQGPVAPDLTSTLRNMVVVFLIMFVIYVALAYLRYLLDRITHWVMDVMGELLGSWSPFELVEGG